MFDALRDETVGGFRRHLHHVAVDVKFPAVIEAAQATVLVARENQRRTPVRAVFIEHTDTAFAVAENDEILTEKPHLDRRTVRLGHFL